MTDNETRHPKDLPPMGSLRFFEAAGRHRSFSRAARELGLTASAITHQVKTLESYLEGKLFARHRHGITLTERGASYLVDVQRILSELGAATRRHRNRQGAGLLKIVAVEIFAEKWLMPRLAQFQSAYPEVVVEFETDHREVDLVRRDFDLWIACTREVKAGLRVDTLFEDTLVPVCSPGLLAAKGRPERANDLNRFPLLYHLEWQDDWAIWFARQHAPAADLAKAMGFRLYSMVIQAAVDGMGVALGHSRMIAPEVQSGRLVTLLDAPVAAPGRYLLATRPGSEEKPEVRAFRAWLLDLARIDDEWARSGGALNTTR